MDEEGSRRRFLKSVGALSAALPAAAAAQHAGHASAKSEKYMFLAPAEVTFLDAAVAEFMVKRNAIFVPTLVAYEATMKHGRAQGYPEENYAEIVSALEQYGACAVFGVVW